MSKRAEANRVIGAKPPEQLAGTVAEELQIALHAARDVEQHDETNGLR
jgi:hypothetical protein